MLTVRLVKALNLSPMEKEWSKPCNPYVIVQLLPDYRHQLQSTVHTKTTNPRFDETFEFEVRLRPNLPSLETGFVFVFFLKIDEHANEKEIFSFPYSTPCASGQ